MITRRGVLSATQRARPTDDAELLAACEAFADVDREVWLEETNEARLDDAAYNELCERWRIALERVADLPAQTTSGLLAKAKAALTAVVSIKDFIGGNDAAAALLREPDRAE